MATIDRLRPTDVRVLWSPIMANYYFGDYHPMHPSRLDATASLARDLGIFDLPQVQLEEPEIATLQQLMLAHDYPYIDAVQKISANPQLTIASCGLGTEDTPGFKGVHEASARLAG
ncbi:MAG: acetoin utilization protein AcuC, partial [Rothia sp. (in: high G+C Gram-positive bacteria)]|nr:acetoin utilization protein AcuC [Rothia sp. (in: high G+C Gram-positive bacteria)]